MEPLLIISFSVDSLHMDAYFWHPWIVPKIFHTLLLWQYMNFIFQN